MRKIVLILTMLLLSACGKQEAQYAPEFSDAPQNKTRRYVVGIHPLHNPKLLFEVYGPIVDYIDRKIPEATFVLEASRNYEEFDRRLGSGYFDFAMPNPYQTVRSLKQGYRVFGKMSDDENFRGLILVRKDSKIQEVADLKGQAVAYPALTAVAATMMPQYFFQKHGLDVRHDIDNRYVGSQESSIMNVYLGHVAAGATWPVPWKSFVRDQPEIAAQLEVKWQTEPLQNNGWVVRKDVPAEIVGQFSGLLLGLHQSPEGLEMLARVPLSRFDAADDNTYAPMRRFLEEFSRSVRPLEL